MEMGKVCILVDGQKTYKSLNSVLADGCLCQYITFVWTENKLNKAKFNISV